ncbi:hypothetical protein [Stutzerimonas nitrititolerans]|uniref:hypothetical protein n=1 Tax=Stutzerimonas nitrititolerans TaxID=2482751 RepID=UPI00289AD96D|nr:hypothetical protein [Stutzerimonas nitrititolerans]
MAVDGHCLPGRPADHSSQSGSTFAAMKKRKKQLGVGVGLAIGVIIGIIADNLVMGIGIGLAIGIAMSFESKG